MKGTTLDKIYNLLKNEPREVKHLFGRFALISSLNYNWLPLEFRLWCSVNDKAIKYGTIYNYDNFDTYINYLAETMKRDGIFIEKYDIIRFKEIITNDIIKKIKAINTDGAIYIKNINHKFVGLSAGIGTQYIEGEECPIWNVYKYNKVVTITEVIDIKSNGIQVEKIYLIATYNNTKENGFINILF